MDKRTVKYPRFVKFIVLGLVILLLIGCAHSDKRTFSSQCARGQCGGETISGSDGLSTGEKVGIGIGAAVGAFILGKIIYDQVNQNEEDSKNKEDGSSYNWATHGPLIPSQFIFSNFSLKGYIQGEWPLAIDFHVKQSGKVYIIISAENIESYVHLLNGKNMNRQMKIIDIPERFGNTPTLAKIELRAIDENNNETSHLPIQIFGMAAGPRAVGSIGIDQVNFGPDSIHIDQGDKAHYYFFARKSFDQVFAEFRKIENKNGVLQASETIKEEKIAMPAIDESTGQWIGSSTSPFTWDGRTINEHPSKGLHLLQIRSWYSNSNTKDWGVSFSPDWVAVQH
ncbi:MAG TPA: hypothetical protein PKJ85_05730 [Nitrosomonas nitrosa]|nr:hypothetical protein [Nitrosomonas sp.]HNP51282.1 hypothetical protein [Nitrosomonas nitrosa]